MKHKNIASKLKAAVKRDSFVSSNILLGEAGILYVFKPFQYEYNPEFDEPPKVAVLLARVRDSNGWQPGKYRILGPNGIEELWNNRWYIEEQ